LFHAQSDAEHKSRFLAEAEAVARLQHPGIVQVYEIAEHDGRPFFALEYVGGGSLEERLAGKPLRGRPAAHLVEALANAMPSAHQSGIVHRDLKPANILIAESGLNIGDTQTDLPTAIKITDFGLAKQLDDASGRTHHGDVLGTPSYMAPEQAAGKNQEITP